MLIKTLPINMMNFYIADAYAVQRYDKVFNTDTSIWINLFFWALWIVMHYLLL